MTAPIFLAVGNDRQFEKLAVLLGRADLAQDPRFKTNPDRVRARDELKLELEKLLAQWNCDELAEKLEIDDYRGTGAPIKMSRNRPSYRLKRPQLGEHNGEF